MPAATGQPAQDRPRQRPRGLRAHRHRHRRTRQVCPVPPRYQHGAASVMLSCRAKAAGVLSPSGGTDGLWFLSSVFFLFPLFRHAPRSKPPHLALVVLSIVPCEIRHFACFSFLFRSRTGYSLTRVTCVRPLVGPRVFSSFLLWHDAFASLLRAPAHLLLCVRRVHFLPR